MANQQKKCRTTGKKSLAYRGKSGQNTGHDFLALGLGVVLYLPRKSDQKVTERVPKTNKKKCDQTPFADLLLRHPDNWLSGVRSANCWTMQNVAAIAEAYFRDLALRFKGCDRKSLAICDLELRFPRPKPLLSAGFLAIWLRQCRHR